jgi:release factor glutamine methyltransferase
MANKEIEWLLADKYNGVKTDDFFSDCKKLALGEPLAYIIGWVSFLECKIWLDNHPLIPRPETEFWVEEAIAAIRGGKTISLGIETEPTKVLDLCSGSGCIGVSVAKSIPETCVDFGEIDVGLLPTINKNISENLLDANLNKYHSIHTNLFSNLKGIYNFILTNPPYIDKSLDRTDENVKTNEPYLALFGGIDGMEIIKNIIEESPQHLAQGGQLWIEHEPEQSETIVELGKGNNFTVSTHKDQYGVERYSILVLQ